MKRKMKSFTACIIAAAAMVLPCSTAVHGATIDEVISTAYEYGLFESNEKAVRYALEAKNPTPETLDAVIDRLKTGRYDLNALIADQIDKGNIPVPEPEINQETQNPEAGSEPAEGTAGNNFSEMTEEEKKEYVQNLSDAEKKEIIKNLDTDKQLEIIDTLIGVGAELGINISLENLTDDKLEYSVRDENGQVLDISSMGNNVDDTGIDYTVLYIAAAGVILFSACGLAVMAKLNGSER